MKQQLSILMGGLIALGLPLQTQAQDTPAPAHISTAANFGPKVEWDDITEVKVTNMQGDTLGRIQDLTLDLSNGRVVEVLVVSDQTFRLGGKTVAVPPGAFIPDVLNKVYQINMSAELFKDAPAFDLSKWTESTSTEQVTAAYRYFGQVPEFLGVDEASGRTTPAGRLVASLGIVERMSKIINMPVNNLDGVLLGRVESLSLDVPHGHIANVSISTRQGPNSPIKFSTVIPPTLLSFNEKRDELRLDVTKVQYSEEPHVNFEFGESGQVVSTREQAATGPHTDVALVQGVSFRDINITAKIYQAMQNGKLDTYGVQVATLEGRVTLRGSVINPGTKIGIGSIAIGLVKLDNVDNQIEVTQSAATMPASTPSAPALMSVQSSL